MTTLARPSTLQDVFYMRPLHICAQVLGLLPLFGVNNLTRATIPPWNGIFALLCFGAVYVYEVYTKLTYLAHMLPRSVFVTDFGGDFALMIANLVGIIRLCFYKRRTICLFITRLIYIDQELREIYPAQVYPRKVFLVEFILTNIIFVLLYIYIFYIWMRAITWPVYKWYFLRDIQCYHSIVMSLVMRNYVHAICNRIVNLNEKLELLRPSKDPQVSTSNAMDSMDMIKHKINTDFQHVITSRKIFAHIAIVIEIFNEIFGWLYAILYFMCLVYLLTAFNVGLVYGAGEVMDTKLGIPEIIVCLFWCCYPLFIAFNIFSSADNCYYQFKRTTWICYSIMDEWTTVPEADLLVEELEKFAQQVEASHLEIHAAGWFIVNNSTFFTLIGSLSSYIIVLTQFM